jgi:hypothetical protein
MSSNEDNKESSSQQIADVAAIDRRGYSALRQLAILLSRFHYVIVIYDSYLFFPLFSNW